MHWSVVGYFSTALVLGYSGARLIGKHDAASPGSPGAPSQKKQMAVQWKSGDLADWARRIGTQDDETSRADWRDWSDEELRAAMDTALKDPGMALSLSTEMEVLRVLFEESLKRDFDEALKWFDGIVSEVVKARLTGTLAPNWPKDRAEEGLEYVIANRELFENSQGTSSGRIIKMAIESAARRGPAEVDALFGTLRENRLDPRYAEGWEFPAGFDFRQLMAKPETLLLAEKANLFFAGIWVSRDRESAFQELVVGTLGEGRVLPNLFSDVLSQNGAKQEAAARERAKWLGTKLNDMTPEGREIEARILSNLQKSPKAMADFVQSFTDEDRRWEISSLAMKELEKNGPKPTFELLDAFDDLPTRLRLLDEMDTSHLKGRWTSREELETLMRAKFIEWQVPEDRASSIVERFQGGRR